MNPVYEPLGDGETIRLLKVTRATNGDALRGHLTVHKCEEEPQYRALSYVWGR